MSQFLGQPPEWPGIPPNQHITQFAKAIEAAELEDDANSVEYLEKVTTAVGRTSWYQVVFENGQLLISFDTDVFELVQDDHFIHRLNELLRKPEGGTLGNRADEPYRVGSKGSPQGGGFDDDAWDTTGSPPDTSTANRASTREGRDADRSVREILGLAQGAKPASSTGPAVRRYAAREAEEINFRQQIVGEVDGIRDQISHDDIASTILRQAQVTRGLLDQMSRTSAVLLNVRPMQRGMRLAAVQNIGNLHFLKANMKIRINGNELRADGLSAARLLSAGALRTRGFSINGQTPLVMLINWATSFLSAVRANPGMAIDSIMTADDETGEYLRILRSALCDPRTIIKWDCIDPVTGLATELDEAVGGGGGFTVPYQAIEDFVSDETQGTLTFRGPVNLDLIKKEADQDSYTKGSVLLRTRCCTRPEQASAIFVGSTEGHSWLTEDSLTKLALGWS
jgi:hypothetical protein